MIGMQNSLEDELISAIMTKTITVLVEGNYDVKVYDKIINNEEKLAEVIAIETIENFTEGCRAVVDAARYVDNMTGTNHIAKDYILGVIDKDVKDFRNEIPNVKALLVLDVYSIESHFINIEVIDFLLRMCVQGTSDLYTTELEEEILVKCINSMELLYIASLEALKGSLDSNYTAEFKYSYEYGRLKDNVLFEKIIGKKIELMEFALSLSLSHDLKSLKKICKGKWLLSYFCEELEKSLKKLSNECKSGVVPQCQMCVKGVCNSCMYRMLNAFSHRQMREMAKQVTGSNELVYIKDKVRSLNHKVNNTKVA